MSRRSHSALPGFGLAMGWTVTWLSLIVLIPLATLVWKSTSLGWDLGRGVLTAALVVVAGRRVLGSLRRVVRRAAFAGLSR